MSEENSIQVNFGKPMPLFPLDQVILLPQQVHPLHIFEPRYRQMVEHALDGAGQIAMAVFEGEDWKKNYHGRPGLRPAVCIGQIVQHEKLPDGRYNIWLQGVCRARILRELAAEQGRLYRQAMLEPVGLEGLIVAEEEEEEGEEFSEETMAAAEAESKAEERETLVRVRGRIRDMLTDGPLTQLAVGPMILEHLKNDEIPTAALLELLSFTVVSDPKLRYQLLAESQVERRADIILHEMQHIADLVVRVKDQHPEDWPKGCSWN